MSAKALNPDQHSLLHYHYPPSECCLCIAESRIKALEDEVKELREQLGKLCTESEIE